MSIFEDHATQYPGFFAGAPKMTVAATSHAKPRKTTLGRVRKAEDQKG
jgi:hypothetical protein